MSEPRFRTLNRPDHPFWNAFSESLAGLERSDPSCLSRQTGNSRLLEFSDYRGDIKRSPYRIASFLFVDAAQVHGWDVDRC